MSAAETARDAGPATGTPASGPAAGMTPATPTTPATQTAPDGARATPGVVPATAPGPAPADGGPPGGRERRVGTRLFRSELWLIFGRRRNWVGMAVLCTIPVLVNIVTKVSAPRPGGGPPFLAEITSNGLFAALASIGLELPLFLPIAVASIAGDAVAGEAHLGTLRYLLAVPAGRTRLLAVKFAALSVFAAASTLLVAAVGAVMGLAMFGGGPMISLSGTELPFGDGLVRTLLCCGYVTVMLIALAAIGLFVSTLTEQPVGATVAILILTLASEIADAIPQLDAVHRYLPTHYWLAFGDLLRDPIAADRTVPGLVSAAIYTAVFASAAWARFGGKDVTS